MTSPEVSVDLRVRVAFGHAVVQHLADRLEIDVLHIKGWAWSPLIRPFVRAGNDADVIVRPASARGLIEEMRAIGWTAHGTFTSGSPFAHATTLTHETWGSVDVHQLFPGIGIDPTEAFDVLWAGCQSVEIAGVACPVPSVPAQVLLLVLNSARGGRGQNTETLGTLASLPSEVMRDCEELVRRLHADVAFAAGTGNLEQFRGARDYSLWRIASQGGTRLQEWTARVRAAPSLRGAAALILRAPLVNVPHLAHVLGRAPTRWDIVKEFFARPLRGLREQVGVVGARVRRGRPR
ncbi:hypothetical protein V5H98_16650 [Georgenia sp. M64]|uniref:hypothetical protein n=1 Tax=Georgenia sp. M64 TaxID=3120520 RepID=UPI0030DEF9AF